MSEWEDVPDEWEDVPVYVDRSGPRVTMPEHKYTAKQIGRGIGLVGRSILNTFAGPPLVAMDAGIGARNLLTGSNHTSASEMWRQGLNDIGAPEPASRMEKGIDIASQMLLGSKIPGPSIANQAPANFGRVMPSYGPARPDASSSAQASVAPGVSASESVISGAPEVTASGGGYSFGSVGDDASSGLNSARKQIYELGKKLGMKSTPGQATGSKALQQLEAKLESQPMTSGPFNALKAVNARIVNKEAAAAIGEKADVVDSNVLARANERLGEVFSSVRDETPRNISPEAFVKKFQSINDEYEGLIPKGIGSNPLVQRLFSYAEKGGGTGRQLGDLSSKLGRAVHKEMTSGAGDRELGMALGKVKDYVDDLVEQGLDHKRLSEYQTARTQYRTFLTLLKPGVTNTSSGEVSGATLANVLARSDKGGFSLGKNQSPLYTVARYSQAFKPIVGDSGTATRMPLQGITDLAMRLPMNIATRAYTSSPAINLAVKSQATANKAGSMMGKLAQAKPTEQELAMMALFGSNSLWDNK